MSNKSSAKEYNEDEVRKESLKLFPEREGERKRVNPASNFLYGDPARQRLACEKNIIDAVENFPLVKIMMSALKSQGW